MKLILVLALLPNLLIADTNDDDPLACVDPLIAAAFLSAYGTTYVPEISQDIPTKFSGIQIPEGLDFLGSSVTGRLTQIAFRSDFPVKKAEILAIQLLERDGWTKVNSRMYSGTGFQTASNDLSMCHDDRGVVSISTWAFRHDTIVKMLAHSYSGRMQSCEEINQPTRIFRSEAHAILPKLELPTGAKSGGAGSGSGGNGSVMEASSHVDIEVSMAPEELSGFFGAQIESQDWVFDSGWTGDLATGSVWSRQSGKTRYIGFLTVINGKRNNFNVSFSAKSLNQ